MCSLCALVPKSGPVRAIVLAVIILLIIAITFSLVQYTRDAIRDKFNKGRIEDVVPVTSNFDGSRYKVHTDFADSKEAADLLAQLNDQLSEIIGWLRHRYIGAPGSPPTAPAHLRTPERLSAVKNMLARYNPDNLAENSPLDETGDSSYCLDKGAVIAICMRTRETKPRNGIPAMPVGQLHDLNTLIFVTLHEIAHTAIEDIDHPPKFWSTFRFILEEAELSGIYQSPDFAHAPVQYCGIYVDYNPRFDHYLSSI